MDKKSSRMEWVKLDLSRPEELYNCFRDYAGKGEGMLFVMNDGNVLFLGGGENTSSVDVPLYQVRKELFKAGKDYKDVASIIHNHSHEEDFSPADYKVYQAFHNLGFAGNFQSYYPRIGQIRTMKTDKIQ